MRKLGYALIWLFLAALPVCALTLDTLPNYQDQGMRLYVRGTQKLQDGDYIGAVEDLRQAVRNRPDLAEGFHNLGFAFEKTGDLKSAAAAYERALTIRPNYASALNNLGFLLATTETDIQKAVKLCQRAVELEPNSANFRDSLGWACYKAGRIDEAFINFKAAIKLDPSFAKPHFNLGLCEYNRKNFAEAAKEFTLALQLKPDYLKAYIPLANCYEKLQQNNKALHIYQQALTKAPEGTPVRKHLDRQVKRLTKDSKSFYFTNVKQIQANSKLADFMQKKTRTGNLSGAAGKNANDSFDSSTSFTPVSIANIHNTRAGADPLPEYAPTPRAAFPPPSASAYSPRVETELSVNQERQLEKRYSLCKSYIDRGLISEAQRDLEKIIELGGNSGIARQARNLLLKVRKMQDERLKETAETHLAMGKDFFRAGKYDMAEAEMTKALQRSPGNAEAYKDLALLHYNQGRYKEAYEESKRAIALDRGLKEAYVVLGSLYSKKGRNEDAVRTLKRIRELPGERDAVDDLAERMINTLNAGT
jgi:tetratricopeptide (TPR) repeat protein